MKKTITLLVMLCALLLPLHARDYLTDQNNYLLNYFKQSGTPTQLYLTCSQDVLSNKGNHDIQFTFGGNLSWYNVRYKFWWCWYVFTFGKFDISYKIYYKEANDKTYTLATQGITHYVDNDVRAHEAQETKYEYTVAAILNKPFEHTVPWTFPKGLKTGTYYFKLELSVKPSDLAPRKEYTVGQHYENGSESIGCTYESAMPYISDDNGIVHSATTQTNLTGGNAKIDYINSNKSIMYSDDSKNPHNVEGYRLVYNHPDAEFTLRLSCANTPADTLIGNQNYHGYTQFLCGIGENFRLPTVSEYTNELSQWFNGEFLYAENNMRYMEYVRTHNATIAAFLKKKYETKQYVDGYSPFQSNDRWGLLRFKNVLLQTTDAACKNFNENAVSKLKDYEKENNEWFSRTYHIRDLNYVKLPETNLTDHSIFKVWNKTYYTTKNEKDVTMALGCTYYGPLDNHLENVVSNHEYYPLSFISEQCTMFKLMPKVYFAKLSKAEKETQYVCADSTFIYLSGKEITCGNTSPSLYNPVYVWQMSENLSTWHTIQDSNPHVVNNIEYTQANNKNNQLVVKSTLLNGNKPLYFRQLCILKTFASNQESELYNYPITIGDKTSYYISVPAEHYTVQLLPALLDQHVAFTGYHWPEKTYLCHSDTLPAKTIEFGIVENNNLTDKELTAYQQQAEYKIYQIENNQKKLVSHANSYTLPALQDSIHLACVVAACTDSVTKYVSLYRLKKENISFKNITANVGISMRDSLQCKLVLQAQNGVTPIISFNEHTTNNTYWMRCCVAKKPVTLLQYPWENLDRNGCENLFKQHGWNFYGDTGFNIDDATISQLRDYGIQQQTHHNNLLQQQAVADSVAQNSWKMVENTIVMEQANTQTHQYFIKKQNQMGCWSDSVMVTIEWVSPITGNQIHFKNVVSDTVSIVSGQGNPYIVGSYPVMGGYGAVDPSKGTSYTYQWMRKSSNGQWEPIVINSRLYAQVTDSGTKIINSATKYVSLPAETIKDIQENWEICRFVYSKKHGDENSQIVSISNSLWIISSPVLDSTYIQVKPATCPTDKITITVTEPDNLIDKNTRYAWKLSTDFPYSISSTLFSNTQNKCVIADAKKNFNVLVYRYNTVTGVVSNTVEIPISVSTFKGGFGILYNHHTYQLDDKLTVSPGSKIELVNLSVNAEENLNEWVLQIQDNFMGDGNSYDGTTSNLVNPSCYLYNVGQHKIKLTTTSTNGCSETTVAENIFVQGVTQRNMPTSHFGETENVPNQYALQQVYPTLLNAENGYTVHIVSNKQTYPVALYNLIGSPILKQTSSYNILLDLSFMAQGSYLLQVDNTIYKLIKQ
ncbi:MAG: T9SS type A sorting domain-containing protein [Paludibacteraceae bacterium]|nr:T9SS type A sorting domain-containing protein [Paludibacteraceae bacterium]